MSLTVVKNILEYFILLQQYKQGTAHEKKKTK